MAPHPSSCITTVVLSGVPVKSLVPAEHRAFEAPCVLYTISFGSHLWGAAATPLGNPDVSLGSATVSGTFRSFDAYHGIVDVPLAAFISADAVIVTASASALFYGVAGLLPLFLLMCFLRG